MDDETIDGVTPERINNLIAEAADHPPYTPDGPQRIKVNLEARNYRAVWDLATKLGITFDEALNSMIGFTIAWNIGREK